VRPPERHQRYQTFPDWPGARVELPDEHPDFVPRLARPKREIE
jgi:hypothetical protein